MGFISWIFIGKSKLENFIRFVWDYQSISVSSDVLFLCFNSGKQRQTMIASVLQLPPNGTCSTENTWSYWVWCVFWIFLSLLINSNREIPSYSVYFIMLMTRWGIESILSFFSKADLVFKKVARTSTLTLTVLFLQQKCLTCVLWQLLARVEKATWAEGSGEDVEMRHISEFPVLSLTLLCEEVVRNLPLWLSLLTT